MPSCSDDVMLSKLDWHRSFIKSEQEIANEVMEFKYKSI